jgi:hypothetical protein
MEQWLASRQIIMVKDFKKQFKNTIYFILKYYYKIKILHITKYMT